MPYINNADLPKSVREALPEAAQTIYRGAHNGAGKQCGYKNEARLSKIAWSEVKRKYKQDKDKKWVAREAKAEVTKAEKRKYAIDEWIAIARKGQKITLDGISYTVGQDAINSTKDTWVGANALINHNNVWEKHELVDEKIEGEFVYAKFDQDTINELNSTETNGISIEAILTDIDTNGIVHEMIGTSYSLLYGEHKPACTFEMGCASVTSNDIPTNEVNGRLVTAEESGYEKSLGGGQKNMADKEEVDKAVTFTSEQLEVRLQSAAKEQQTVHDNALKVAVSEGLEAQKEEYGKVIEALKIEKEASEAEIAKMAEVALKERRAVFMGRTGAKEDSEVMKHYDAADTVEAWQTFANEIDFQTPQTAGISSGSVTTEKPETVETITWGADK